MVDLLERAGRVLIENPPVETTTVEVLRSQLRRRRRQRVALGMIPVLVAGALLTVALVRRSGTARSITPAGTSQTIADGSTPSTLGERPLRGTPIEVTGYHIGDTAGLSTVFPDDWFTEDSELVEELLPEWIAVLDDERVVLGFVKGIEFVTPVHDPLPIYGENGEVIGDYDEFGRPALDLMTPSDGTRTDPVGDGSTICVAGTYTIADGDIPKKVADKFKVSTAWLDYVNADTTGYDAFYVGLVINVPGACGDEAPAMADPFGGVRIGDPVSDEPTTPRLNDDGFMDYSQFPEFVPVSRDGVVIGFVRRDDLAWRPSYPGEPGPASIIYDNDGNRIGEMVDGDPVLDGELFPRLPAEYGYLTVAEGQWRDDLAELGEWSFWLERNPESLCLYVTDAGGGICAEMPAGARTALMHGLSGHASVAGQPGVTYWVLPPGMSVEFVDRRTGITVCVPAMLAERDTYSLWACEFAGNTDFMTSVYIVAGKRYSATIH